jgi:hypothetical protein
MAESGAGRVRPLERHHAVFVYMLRAVRARLLGRPAGNMTREVVDELFPQRIITLEPGRHAEIHRAVAEAVDDILARDAMAARPGRQPGYTDRAGAPGLVRRTDVTPTEAIDILEEAYRRVYREHPGLISDEMMTEILDAFEQVRASL